MMPRVRRRWFDKLFMLRSGVGRGNNVTEDAFIRRRFRHESDSNNRSASGAVIALAEMKRRVLLPRQAYVVVIRRQYHEAACVVAEERGTPERRRQTLFVRSTSQEQQRRSRLRRVSEAAGVQHFRADRERRREDGYASPVRLASSLPDGRH